MDRLGRQEATDLARRIVESGFIETPQHQRDRATERNVTSRDIAHCLAVGRVAREPEWNDRHQEWRYRIEGEDIEGVELTLIAAFEDEETLVVVTVF